MKPNMGPGQWVVVWLGVACLGMLASPVTVTAAEPESPALKIPRNRMTHDNAVDSVAFSPDGKTLASGSRTRRSSCGTWRRARSRPPSRDTRLGVSVAYSPDGKTLASGSEDNTIKLWDVATGKQADK